jgi:hypothetical protein
MPGLLGDFWMSSTGPGPRAAAIALWGVDAASFGLLSECLRQFGIETVAVAGDASKSAGCTYHTGVVPLTADAEPVARGIRQINHGMGWVYPDA